MSAAAVDKETNDITYMIYSLDCLLVPASVVLGGFIMADEEKDKVRLHYNCKPAQVHCIETSDNEG